MRENKAIEAGDVSIPNDPDLNAVQARTPPQLPIRDNVSRTGGVHRGALNVNVTKSSCGHPRPERAGPCDILFIVTVSQEDVHMAKFVTLAAASMLALAGGAAIRPRPATPDDAAGPRADPRSRPKGRPKRNRTVAPDLVAPISRPSPTPALPGIQAGLKLNAEQQKASGGRSSRRCAPWRPSAASGSEAFRQRRESRPAAAPSRTSCSVSSSRHSVMTEARSALTTDSTNALKSALGPSLDEDQKRLLPALMREGPSMSDGASRSGRGGRHGHRPR